MNDTELDELLNVWSVPEPSPSIRERLRCAFAEALERKPIPRRRRLLTFARRGFLAAAFVAAGAFLLLVAQTFPRTFQWFAPAGPIPYTVDSEVTRFGDDGSSKVVEYLTSYNHKGVEIALSKVYPGAPFVTFVEPILDRLHQLFRPSSPLSSEQLERRARAQLDLVDAGCVDGSSIGRDTILNYAVVVSQQRFRDQRTTMWLAPDLECFALRVDLERSRPGGAFRLVTRRQALRVTRNQ